MAYWRRIKYRKTALIEHYCMGRTIVKCIKHQRLTWTLAIASCSTPVSPTSNRLRQYSSLSKKRQMVFETESKLECSKCKTIESKEVYNYRQLRETATIIPPYVTAANRGNITIITDKWKDNEKKLFNFVELQVRTYWYNRLEHEQEKATENKHVQATTQDLYQHTHKHEQRTSTDSFYKLRYYSELSLLPYYPPF